jgi:glyoxylase-like metal-dependent hydrolase (beta-lactamase superfamily II)
VPVAEVDVLFEGYIRNEGSRVASTVSLIRDGRVTIVVDPGLVPGPDAILRPLAALGIDAEHVTDLVFSHHHPDHTINAALFPSARIHDHWAIYRGDLWESRAAEGFQISPAVSLIETPGHTTQDITTLAEADAGVVAFTHLWWTSEGPAEDPYAVDPVLLHRNRARVLEVASLIVPGHGSPFSPGDETPR